jgi:signal transduction histidine kinase
LAVLARIGDEALRAGGIIHRLKDLVKKRRTHRSTCDLNDLIRDLEPLAHVDARLHDVRLTFELDDALPLVYADGVQIQQVVLNLIRNGIDAMVTTDLATRETVVRTVTREDGDAEISVLDRGCGMPPNAEETLFEPFFTTKEGGMGMGLSVSRTIITSHGGRIWFTRRPEGGTIMTVTLPPFVESRDARS